MPIFEYQALDVAGRQAKGRIDADTPREARAKLRGRGVHVTQIKAIAFDGAPVKATAEGLVVGKSRRGLLAKLLRGRAQYEITMLTRQFATLLRAGIPVSDALNALVEQIDNRDVEAAFRDVKEKVTQGATLADALGQHPHYFSDLYANMVRAGEASGNLDIILERLSTFMQKQARMRGKVSAVMAYPAIMSFIGTGVVTFLMVDVVPKITKTISKKGGELPTPTVILMGISDFLQFYWWAVLIAALLLSVNFYLFVKTERGRLLFDAAILRLPIFGELFRKQSVSRFATTFSTLLQSGIPVLECLGILKKIIGNQVLANTLEEVKKRIMEGADIASPLRASGVFPSVVSYMISVGEQSGHLDEVLARISEAYDEEIEITTAKVTGMIEPVIIFILAVVVGFIVLAVMLPIIQMSDI